jgi:hypothetical protein
LIDISVDGRVLLDGYLNNRAQTGGSWFTISSKSEGAKVFNNLVPYIVEEFDQLSDCQLLTKGRVP